MSGFFFFFMLANMSTGLSWSGNQITVNNKMRGIEM